MQRRWLNRVAGAVLAALAATPALSEKLTLLTWNFADQEPLVREWIVAFKKSRPEIEVDWLDKKGTEWGAFYQTQLAAGTPPDIMDIQGALWLEYAASETLLDLTPYLAKTPGYREQFNADYLNGWVYEGRNYLVPFYITKTLLFLNNKRLAEANVAQPPARFDDLLELAAKTSGAQKAGFITLTFDWTYWPLFAANSVQLLSADGKKAAFNTPQMLETLTRLAKATQAGQIDKVAWTGRWVEPNSAFSSGNIAAYQGLSTAYFFLKGQGAWVGPETLGVAPMPGGFATANSHGLAISKATKSPEAAWEFVKMVTSESWAHRMGSTRGILTGNIAADKRIIADVSARDPLGARILALDLENTDKIVANWPTPKDARIKEAFWPEIQAALLGQKPPAEALKEAEAKVNRVLSRR